MTILSQDLILKIVSSIETGDSNGAMVMLLGVVLLLCLAGIVVVRKLAYSGNTGTSFKMNSKKITIAAIASIFIIAMCILTARTFGALATLDVTISPTPNVTVSMAKSTGDASAEKVTIKNNEDFTVYLNSILLNTDLENYGKWECKYDGKTIYSGTKNEDYVPVDGCVAIEAGESVTLVWTAKLDSSKVASLDGKSLGQVYYKIDAIHDCQKYEIQDDGEWDCVDCGRVLAGTDDSYITVLDNEQPTTIYPLTADNISETAVGNGEIVKVGNKTTYTNTSGRAQDVIVRTAKASDELEINDTSDGTIYHYDKAGKVSIVKCSDNSFIEKGHTVLIDINKGRIVLDELSRVGIINVIRKDANTFDDVIIADGGVKAENMPKVISREQVTVVDPSGKTKVCKVQKLDADGNVDTSKTETVYAYANGSTGTTEQIKTGASKQNENVDSALGMLILDSGSKPGEKAYTQVQKEKAQKDAADEVINGKIVQVSKLGEQTVLMTMTEFRDSVNDGNTYDGYTVKLLGDVDISGSTWKPIGNGTRATSYTGKYFAGTFDGSNYTISGLTCGTPQADDVNYSGKNVYGLFGAINKATIKNVNLSDVAIYSSSDTVGGIAAYCFGSCEIKNCKVLSGTISGAETFGGVLGRSYNNDGDTENEVIKVDECENQATIIRTNSANNVKGSGIVGYVAGAAGTSVATNTVYVTNCTNSGVVKVETSRNGYVSGVVNFGYSNGSTEKSNEFFIFTNDTNKANLFLSDQVGHVHVKSINYIGTECSYGSSTNCTSNGHVNTGVANRKSIDDLDYSSILTKYVNPSNGSSVDREADADFIVVRMVGDERAMNLEEIALRIQNGEKFDNWTFTLRRDLNPTTPVTLGTQENPFKGKIVYGSYTMNNVTIFSGND